MALEPRMMYDAAAAATLGAAAHHHHQDGGGDFGSVAAAESLGPRSHYSNSGQADPSSTVDHHTPANVQTPAPPPGAAEPIKATSRDATGTSASAGDGSSGEIVFIDPRVANYQVLVSGVKPGVTAVVLDPGQDGLAQIAAYLSAHPDSHPAAIDIVAHGAQGELLLGTTALTDAKLPADAGALQRIGDALAPGGVIALYGCNVASGAAGLQFISDLSHDAGGADVAAASHEVGATALGGSWQLDTATGSLHRGSPFTAATLQAFPDLLSAAPTVTVDPAPTQFTGGGAAVAIDPGLTVTDPSGILAGATVTIVGSIAGDTLTINGTGSGTINDGASGSIQYVFSGSKLTLSGTDTVADYQAALRLVSFGNLSNPNPTDFGLDPTRTIDWQVQDGAAVSGVALGSVTSFVAGENPVSIAIGDFNGDGVLDLAVVNQASNTVSVLLGNSSGGFTPAVDYAVGSAPNSVEAVDLNGDGKLDLVVANTGSNTVSVLLGNGSGGFSAAANFATGSQPVSIAAGDLNGDGRIDLVVADRASNDVTVLLGDGHGGFTAATSVTTGAHPVSVALGDFNGDGRLDLGVADEFSGDVEVMLGDGHGGFGAASGFAVGAFPNSLAVGDLNGDGKLDLVTANGNSVSVLLGDGTGGFAAANTFIAGAGPTGVAIGDINGDGRPDLAVTDGGSSSVSVLLGDGSGGFVSAANLATGTEPAAIAIGDFNGDGAPDLAIADFGSGDVSILNSDGLSAVQHSIIAVSVIDAPVVIDGSTTGTVVEAGGIDNAIAGTPTASGRLTLTDPDHPSDTFQAVAASTPSDHAYGSFTVTQGGSWTYTLGNTNAAVQALNVGDTLTDTFTVRTVDGTGQRITIAIDGADDAPVVAAGNMTAFDANTSQSIAVDPAITVHDVDNAMMSSASVVIQSGFQTGDTLAANTAGTSIQARFDAAHGTLMLSGNDTVADYQKVLASVSFGRTQPQSGLVTIAWQVTDQNNLAGAVATSEVHVVGRNIPPHLYTVNDPLTPAPNVTPISLVLDGSPTAPLELATGDAVGSGGEGRGFYLVHADAVLTTASDATVQINLALASLQAPLGGDVALLTARQANGDPLPDWLKFDPATGTFAGLPPDNAVASIESDPSADSNLITGSVAPKPDLGTDGPAAHGAMTVEVLAQDSKGNIAVTVFTLDLRPHPAGKQSWNPSAGHPRHAPLPPDLAAIEAAVLEPSGWGGMPVRHGHAIATGDSSPTGRTALTEQLASIGWRSMDAQRGALLASLRPRR